MRLVAASFRALDLRHGVPITGERAIIARSDKFTTKAMSGFGRCRIISDSGKSAEMLGKSPRSTGVIADLD